MQLQIYDSRVSVGYIQRGYRTLPADISPGTSPPTKKIAKNLLK